MSEIKPLPHEIFQEIRRSLRQIVGRPGTKILRNQLIAIGRDPDTYEKEGEASSKKKAKKKKAKSKAASPVVENPSESQGDSDESTKGTNSESGDDSQTSSL